MHLLIAQSCRDCNSQAVRLSRNKPTEEIKRELADSIGGMYCIRVMEVEIKELDTDVVIKDE